MNYNGFTGIFIRASEWIMKFGTLTLLWFSFTVTGLVVFGFMPATSAMFSVIRKWAKGEDDFPVVRYFFKVYKKEFFKINLLGLILLVVGLVIFEDWKFFSAGKSFYYYVSYFFVCLSFVYFIILLYIFPVFAHYEYKTIDYIKNSLLIAIMNPITTLTMVGICIIVYCFSEYLPGIVTFFSISAFAFSIAFPANKAFRKIEKRQQILVKGIVKLSLHKK